MKARLRVTARVGRNKRSALRRMETDEIGIGSGFYDAGDPFSVKNAEGSATNARTRAQRIERYRAIFPAGSVAAVPDGILQDMQK